MDEKEYLTPAVQEFENALRHLSPATGRIDPISAAFAAGKRSAARKLRPWHSGIAVLMLVNLGLWCWPSLHNGFPYVSSPEIEGGRAGPVNVADTGHESILPPPEFSLNPRDNQPLSDQSMAALERTALDHGVDALPVAHVPSQRPLNPDKL